MYRFVSRIENRGFADYRSLPMIHENLSTSIEDLSSRIVAIRDSL